MHEGDSFFIAHALLRAMSAFLLRYLTIRPRASVESRLTGLAQGFDEFMNVVMDDAAEVYVKDAKPRRELGTSSLYYQLARIHEAPHPLGRILLKGDNITLIQQVV